MDDALASGQAFRDVALKYSEAPSASAYSGEFTDPVLDPPTVNVLPDIVQGAIADLDVDRPSIWVPYGNGFAAFASRNVGSPLPST